MRRLGFVLLLVLSMTAGAREYEGFDGDDCSSRRISFGSRESFVEQEVIEAAGLRSLKAAVTNAPISVRGGNARGFSITVCKAAELREDLAAIRVSIVNGELQATGPEGREWQVIYSIRMPDGGDLDVSAKNGPLSLRDVDGNVTATTQNGPISVKGGAGTLRVRATNGPLSVDLDGNAWRNGSLDASTKNGPLSVKLPLGYASGVVVESDGHGPVSCRAEGCRRDTIEPWSDEPRRIELGSGPAQVRLSTVNGPVTIKNK